MKKSQKQKFIEIYEEEAQANLNLYTSGKDDGAYERYRRIKEYVDALRSK
tara:strand:+ start:683 stop:832 length:150 start_codon:yes stop_codon:yes gene_type:complete